MSSLFPFKWLADAIQGVLDWFQYFINSIIGFVTSESSSGGFLGLILRNWKLLLAVLIVAGTVINLLIYFARWKPHWWWFAKKRMIVNDELVRPHGQKPQAPAAPVRKPSTIVPKRRPVPSVNSSPQPGRKAKGPH